MMPSLPLTRRMLCIEEAFSVELMPVLGLYRRYSLGFFAAKMLLLVIGDAQELP